jgi:hypothetical protein
LVVTVKVSLMLADAAHAVGGKLYILGGGWSVLTADVPYAIALKIEVPWVEATAEHTFKLELLDADGQPVLGDDEESPLITVDGKFQTGIPAGVRHGVPLDAVDVIPVPALPLAVGRYEWRLTIDGTGHDREWKLAFTRAESPPGLRAA